MVNHNKYYLRSKLDVAGGFSCSYQCDQEDFGRLHIIEDVLYEILKIQNQTKRYV
jgi:hypothetical protein